MYYAFVYSRFNYGVEVYSSCSKKLMDKLQVVQNKLLKLILRRHPRSSTNELHNDLGILKVNHISEICVIIFAVKFLQGDCPPCLKNYLKIRHNPYGTRQRGQLEYPYPRARIGCGFSRVHYRAADLWNKLGSNFKTILDRYELKRSLCENFVSHYHDWIRWYVFYICVSFYITITLYHISSKKGWNDVKKIFLCQCISMQIYSYSNIGRGGTFPEIYVAIDCYDV